MVGRDYEAGGIAKDGAKMVTAVACAQVPKITLIVGGSFGAGNYGMCGRAYGAALPVHLAERAHLGDGRRAGGVGAGDRAARQHRGRRQDLVRGRGGGVQAADPRRNTRREGNPYYATARLWDDGIIVPSETRRVLALAFSAALNAPVEETKFGVFRM